MKASMYLVTCAINGTIVFGIAWIAAAILRRSSASVRHAIWTAAVLCALALPILHVTVPAHSSSAHVAPLVSTGRPSFAADQLAQLPAIVVRALPVSSPTYDWPNWIAAAWVVGAAWFFARMIVGLTALLLVERRSRPLRNARTIAMCSRGVRLLEASSPDAMPATWGVAIRSIIAPRLLLPAGYSDWPAERLRAVVSHELAHIERQDWLWSLIAETARALYWFHPLAWHAVHEMRAESERSCDDAVLAAGTQPARYAGVLLDLARGSIHHPRDWTMALAMARPTNLERRFTAMLNPNVNRRALSRRAAAFISSAALLVVAPLATLRAPAQELPGTLQGHVFHDGAPVSNAVVSAQIAGEATTRGMTVTDATGAFDLIGLTTGSYQLTVRRTGFEVLVIPGVDLRHGETVSRNVTMESESAIPRASSTRAPDHLEQAIAQANLVNQVPPRYPASAKSAGIQGQVLLKAVISLEGSPISLQITNPDVDPALARAAVEAVSHWRYNPAMLNGSPVEVETEIAVNFTLSQ